MIKRRHIAALVGALVAPALPAAARGAASPCGPVAVSLEMRRLGGELVFTSGTLALPPGLQVPVEATAMRGYVKSTSPATLKGGRREVLLAADAVEHGVRCTLRFARELDGAVALDVSARWVELVAVESSISPDGTTTQSPRLATHDAARQTLLVGPGRPALLSIGGAHLTVALVGG